MAEKGEDDKMLAVARHIAHTLGQNDSIAGDILQIFSNFDNRFPQDNLSDKILCDGGDIRSSAVLEHAIKALQRRISQYLAADHPIWSDSADSSAFLDAIDELHNTIKYWNRRADEKSVSTCLDRADELLHQTMFRLEDEFKMLMERGGDLLELSRVFGSSESALNLSSDSDDDEDSGDEHQIPVAHPVSDFDIVIEPLPSGTINDLHEIVKRMEVSGFGKECSHAYSGCRRDFIDESLSRLGLQKLSVEEVQKMPWPRLEEEIERWIKSANVVVRILFPSERRLCDRVFLGFSNAADLSFMEVCRGSTIQLLCFADVVAIRSRSPERLFKILDMFETLRDLLPEIESVFCDQYCVSLRNDALAIWRRLGDSVRGIFMELENLISRDPAKTHAASGGRHHPITRYVMNYLLAACRSRHTLEQIFNEVGNPNNNYRKPDDRSCPSSSLAVQVGWVMQLLETNLVAKSKTYKDPALCSIFLMNNESYMVQKVKGSDLGALLGDDWIRKHAAKSRKYLMNYHRNSWSKVNGVLKPDAAGSMSEKLSSFNHCFRENCKAQSTWVIFDDQLREDARELVAGNLLAPYSNLIRKLQSAGEDTGKWLSAAEVVAGISEMFQGSGNK